MDMVGKQIAEILKTLKGEDFHDITFNPDLNIMEEIGLDSLQMINFVLQLEDEFEIQIDFDDFDYSLLENFSSLEQYIAAKISHQ